MPKKCEQQMATNTANKSETATPATTKPRRRINFRWRVVDIVIAAVIAVAAGVAFWGWDAASTPLGEPLKALLPGLQGLLSGVWLFAGVLVALIIRKPGAALFAEFVAAFVELTLGGPWGPVDLLEGLLQGLGAEIIFAIFLYTSWRLGTALLAGAAAGVGLTIFDLIFYYPGLGARFDWIYGATSVLSGAVIAGLVSWLLVRAIAQTGALNRFAAGRTSKALV
jgi:energy-coupling factor transport system substrate-specific component